jgi:hypothetical protein
MSPNLSALNCFSDRVLCFFPGLISIVILLPMPSVIHGISGKYHMPGLIVEMGVLLALHPGWSQTSILLISTSDIAGIVMILFLNCTITSKLVSK